MPNLYAYTHKYKKYIGNHNSHNSDNKHNGSNGVFGDRRTAPSLHDITLKMRKMYDAVAGSFSSFNDPSKPFTAIDYRRIHNGWKNKKNRRFNRMNRMNRMKTMNGGKNVYEFVADKIGEDDDDGNISATVKIHRRGKEDFEAFIEKIAANDAETAQSQAETAQAKNAPVDNPAAAKATAKAAADAAAKVKAAADAAAKVKAAAAAAGDGTEQTLLLKAAALASIATAMAIASENEKSTEDETAGLLVKAAALASIATAMAIVSENP
jgi:hypothetical protein